MKLNRSSTTRWPNKMSVNIMKLELVLEDGLTFSHVFWNQNFEAVSSLETLEQYPFRVPTMPPLKSCFPFFIEPFPQILVQELNINSTWMTCEWNTLILENRNVKSAKTNKLTFGHAWLLLCMDWGRRWQHIMELFLGPSQKDSDPTKGFRSKGPKVAVCHQERKIISQIECVVRRSANSQTRNKTISCSKIGQIFSFYQHRQDWMI